MKPLPIILLQVLCLLISCANNQASTNYVIDQPDTSSSSVKYARDSFPAQKIITPIICRGDASQSYALYIPSFYKINAVIYFFDPHGNGALPLEKYRTLADAYHFVLIGSNNSKNGNDWQTTENIWQTLFNDTQSRLQFDANRAYTCGFSGGAKVASYVALHHDVIKGVIAGGAGLPDGTAAGNFNFSFTAVAGEGDMNMTDLVALNNELDKTQTKHRIIFFNGKHEWAPESTMNIAFAGLDLDAMRNKSLEKNDSLIDTYVTGSKKRLNDDIKKHDLIQAERECSLSVNMLDGISDVTWFTEKTGWIKNDPAYKTQLLQQQKLLLLEENKKTEFNAQFEQADITYWTKTINEMNAAAKSSTPQGAMNQRLLAYLSLAFYSISNQFINNNQNKEAEYFVSLYKLADPTNSEAWYFSAVLNARNNNAKAVNDDLLKAAANGFTDTNRMLQQPEFQNLQAQINFVDIEAKMKN